MNEDNKHLLKRIIRKLENAADEAFNPEEAVDSDGTDQAMRDGILHAQEIVEDQFRTYAK